MSQNDKISEFYDEYVARQRRIGVNLRHQSIFQKVQNVGLKRNHNVLEVGCGIGTFTSLIIPYIDEGSITAMDISPKSIEVAKHDYESSNVNFLAQDATAYDFKGELFDVIILPDVLEHIPIDLHDGLFKKLSSVLTHDGFIFIHIPNPVYLEWCHKNKPEILQVIDQPITTDILVENTYKHGLFIEELKTYPIWVEHNDYQYIVLKKNNYQDFNRIIEYPPSFLDKVKHKLNAWRKK